MKARGIRRGSFAAIGVATLVIGSIALGASAAHASHPKKHVVMHGYTCTVIATKHHRSVVGHAGDVVCGVRGNDILRAAGPGPVVLIAGPGHDTLIASSDPNSQDTLIGGTGTDTIETGSSGDDVIETGSGNDNIDCAGAQVTIVGTDQGDTQNADCQANNVDNASLEFHGTVNTTNGSTTMNLQIGEANDTAQTWLGTHGNPQAVDISLVGATIEREGGGTLTVGDEVEVAANDSGSGLVAVDVQAQAPDSNSD